MEFLKYWNCFTSVFAGLAVFSTLGFLAHQSGVPVSEVVSSGIGLVFVVYPAAIAQFPFFPEVLGVLFFAMLLTLGVDSAFSLTEAASTSIFDEYPHLNRSLTIGVICIILFILGLFFTSGSGFYWLDIIDHYINTFILLIIGILEVVTIGWIFGAEQLRDYLNGLSSYHLGRWYDLSIKFIVPAVLIVLLALNVLSEFTEPYGGYEPLALAIGFILVVVVGTLASCIIARVAQRRHRESDTS